MILLRRSVALLVVAAVAAAIAASAGKFLSPRRIGGRSAPSPSTRSSPSADELRLLAAAAAELCDLATRSALSADGLSAAHAAETSEIEPQPFELGPPPLPPGAPLPGERSGGVASAAGVLRRSLGRLVIPGGVVLRVSHPSAGEVLVLPEGAPEALAAPVRRFTAVSELGWTVTAEARLVAAGDSRLFTGREAVAAAGMLVGGMSLLAGGALALRGGRERAARKTLEGSPSRGPVPTGSLLRLRERYGAPWGEVPPLRERTSSPILRKLLAEVGRKG